MNSELRSRRSDSFSRSRQLAKLIHRRIQRRYVGGLMTLAVIVVAVAVPLLIVPRAVRTVQALREKAELAERAPKLIPSIQYIDGPGDPIQIQPERWEEVGLKLGEIIPSPPTQTLTLDGVLFLDPEDYVVVRSRFVGEFVDAAQLPDTNLPGQAKTRSIRFGDTVKKGQFLGSVWSRELGEKKSELAQHLSTLQFNRETLTRFANAQNVIPTSQLREAERQVRESEISVERVEKTLRSWQLSQEEIQSIVAEVVNTNGTRADSNDSLSRNKIDQWARVDILSPIDGTIVEKNVTIGALVDQDDMLFKVANLDHLDVRTFAYEEDIATLQRLNDAQRQWNIKLKGDPSSEPIHGVFDRIGDLIDPVQHTGVVIGWVGNQARTLRPGQFVTASIAIPDKEPLLCVPDSAVIDYDGNSFVVIQSREDASRFDAVQVKLVRHHHGQACIRTESIGAKRRMLGPEDHVLTAAAMEVFSDYQTFLETKK